MSEDPNWFYSSLAQAAAGLVGLFGGILATRIQSELERASARQDHVATTLRALDKQVQLVLEPYRAYIDHSPNQLALLQGRLNSGPFTADTWFSPFDTGKSGVHVETHQHNLDVETARLALVRAVLPSIDRLVLACEGHELTSLADEIEAAAAAHPAAEGLPDRLLRVATCANDAASALVGLRAVTADPMMAWLVRCLGAITVVSIIAPLWFLAARTGLQKVLFLSAFAVSVGVLLLYVHSRALALRRAGRYKSLFPPKAEADLRR